MEGSSISADDLAYQRALSSAKEKHSEGGTDPIIHQQELNAGNAGNAEGGNEKSSNKPAAVGGKGLEKGNKRMEGVEEEEEDGGGENISDPSSNYPPSSSSNINNESNEREVNEGGMVEGEEGSRLGSAPLAIGGGGGASSGVLNVSHRDVEGRIRELEALQRHPLPKIHDAEHEPKAIASTFHPAAHLPPSDASGYRPHGVNEHMRKGGGKAPHSQKMIMQPGGKYGQRY